MLLKYAHSLFIIASLLFAGKTQAFESHQTEGKPKTIHIVPHSHDDVGWLKTVDQYFYGDRQDIQRTMVGVELTSVIDSLLADSRRKFMEVEMKFFRMWWDEQNDEMREKTRGLVRNGQLELVNAGWSMHDEACPIYEDMIDNMMIGHDFILKEFGVKPRIGWQIDPFGHSNTNARIFAEMGFDAWFFARLDHDDIEKRKADKEMEFVWMPNPESIGKDLRIFTHVLYAHYDAPEGFDFEIDSGSQFIVSNPNSRDFNAEERSQALIKLLDERVEHYVTDDIFVVFGGDFRYKAAAWNYRNIDALIDYMNEHHGDQYFLRYSTPSDYVDIIANKNISWPTKYDDMFPYSAGNTDWWTGFFTSRANAKGFIRRASSNHHSSSFWYAQKVLDQSVDANVTDAILEANYGMLDALGIVQHHDAVTGTAKQAVANDYNKRLSYSMNVNNIYYSNMMTEKIFKQFGFSSSDWQQCEMTNSTYLDCPIGKKQNSKMMYVAAHNPSSLDLQSVKVAIPQDKFYMVSAFNSTTQKFEIIEAEKSCFDEQLANGTFVKNCQMEIRVLTPAQGVSLLKFNLFNMSFEIPNVFIDENMPESNKSIQSFDGGLKLVYTGMNSTESTVMFDFIDQVSGNTEQFEFSMKYWESYTHMLNNDMMNSGAYAFHPMEGQYHPYPYGDVKKVSIQKGDFSQQFHITFGKHLYGQQQESMTSVVHISLDKDLPLIKIDVELGSLPFQEYLNGYEVVPNFHVKNFDQNRTFYTDSNGLEMQKRVQDQRPSFISHTTETVTNNYYPINTAISIQDANSKRRMTVMNDRAQGGTSIAPGTIELMQNRESPSDDNKGVGEPLQEKDEYGNGIQVKSTYYVQICDGEKRLPLQRVAQHKINDVANLFFNFEELKLTKAQSCEDLLVQEYKDAGIVDTVKVVHVPKEKNLIHLRLQNLADLYDSNSKSYTVDISKIADALWKSANLLQPHSYDMITIKELSLTGNMYLDEMQQRQVKWTTVDDHSNQFPNSVIDQGFTVNSVKLEPQRIRVFSVQFIPSDNGPKFLN